MRAHVPPDISYGLECAAETFDISADMLTFYHVFNTEPLAPKVDGFEFRGRGRHGSYLRALSRVYARGYNDWFWTEARPKERAWCLSAAAKKFGRSTAEVVDSLYTRYISDALKGGFVPDRRDNQQRWLERNPGWRHTRRLTDELAHKVLNIRAETVCDALEAPASFYARLGNLPSPRVNARTIRALQEMVDHRDIGKPITMSAIDRYEREQRRVTNKVLKKSSAFLSRLIGPKDATMFISGRKITVEGDRFAFVLEKRNLASMDWNAMVISVEERATRRHLFDLCYYNENTPALDQLSALVMAIRTGHEDEIIAVGNKLRVSAAAYEFGFAGLARPPSPIARDMLDALSETVEGAGRKFQFPDDDTIQHLTPGTTDFVRSHADTYLGFAARTARQLGRDRFPEVLRTYFTPHGPETVRPIAGSVVGRELLPEHVSATANLTYSQAR